MDSPRTSCAGVVLTASELAAVDAARGEQTRSAWIREAVLRALEPVKAP